jgi:hypothetical protein
MDRGWYGLLASFAGMVAADPPGHLYRKMKLGQSLSLGKRQTLQVLKGVQGMENILQRSEAVKPELVQNVKSVRQVTSS